MCGKSIGKNRKDFSFSEFFQLKDTTTREESVVAIEGGVFSGGSDEMEETRLDSRQQSILLQLGKAMDLIDKHAGLLAESASILGGFQLLPQVAQIAGASRQRHKVVLGSGGDDAGQSGLPAARRAPQQHARQPVAGDQWSQHGQHLLLPHEAPFQAAGPASLGQRHLQPVCFLLLPFLVALFWDSVLFRLARFGISTAVSRGNCFAVDVDFLVFCVPATIACRSLLEPFEGRTSSMAL